MMSASNTPTSEIQESHENIKPSLRSTSSLNTVKQPGGSLTSDDRSEPSLTRSLALEPRSLSNRDTEPTMSATSTRSMTSSVSTIEGSTNEHRRSSLGRVMDKAKAKFSGAERLPNNENEFQRMKAQEIEKQRRKEEYERLGLGDKTKFGSPGMGNWSM